jgi:hypothetical protein
VPSRRPELPAFGCLAHPPIPVGIPLLDSIRPIDGDGVGTLP